MMGWFKSNCRERLPIYKSLPSDGIPGEVSLRINAIRETFEESGILMLRDAGRMAEIHGGSTAGSIRPTLKVLEKNVVKKWRERVHDNAYDFITMCRSGGCPWIQHIETISLLVLLQHYCSFMIPLHMQSTLSRWGSYLAYLVSVSCH